MFTREDLSTTKRSTKTTRKLKADQQIFFPTNNQRTRATVSYAIMYIEHHQTPSHDSRARNSAEKRKITQERKKNSRAITFPCPEVTIHVILSTCLAEILVMNFFFFICFCRSDYDVQSQMKRMNSQKENKNNKYKSKTCIYR